MKKGDQLAFRPHPRSFVDQPDTCLPAPLERFVDILNSNANVMYPGASLCQVLADGSVGAVRFEEFDQRFATLDCGNPGTVGVCQWGLGHAEHVSEEGKDSLEGAHGYSDVCYARSAGGAGTGCRAARIRFGARLI